MKLVVQIDDLKTVNSKIQVDVIILKNKVSIHETTSLSDSLSPRAPNKFSVNHLRVPVVNLIFLSMEFLSRLLLHFNE